MDGRRPRPDRGQRPRGRSRRARSAPSAARRAAPPRPAGRVRGRHRRRAPSFVAPAHGLRRRPARHALHRDRPSARPSEAYKQAHRRGAARRTSCSPSGSPGVPVAVINTPYVQRLGTKAGPLARWMLRGRRTKHWMRTIYALRSLWQLKRGLLRDAPRARLLAGRQERRGDRPQSSRPARSCAASARPGGRQPRSERAVFACIRRLLDPII